MWSQLPYDVINEVANHLNSIEDFLAFSLVCKFWHSIYREKSWLSSPKVPGLMLNINKNGEQRCLSLYKHKILKIPFLSARNRRMWGSSYEWMITNCPDLKIQLLNPISRVQHDLPPYRRLCSKTGRM